MLVNLLRVHSGVPIWIQEREPDRPVDMAFDAPDVPSANSEKHNRGLKEDDYHEIH